MTHWGLFFYFIFYLRFTRYYCWSLSYPYFFKLFFILLIFVCFVLWFFSTVKKQKVNSFRLGDILWDIKISSFVFCAISSTSPVYLFDLLQSYTPPWHFRSCADSCILCVSSVYTVGVVRWTLFLLHCSITLEHTSKWHRVFSMSSFRSALTTLLFPL